MHACCKITFLFMLFVCCSCPLFSQNATEISHLQNDKPISVETGFTIGHLRVQGPKFIPKGSTDTLSTFLYTRPGIGGRMGCNVNILLGRHWGIQTGVMLTIYSHRYSFYSRLTRSPYFRSADGNGRLQLPVFAFFHQEISPKLRLEAALGYTGVFNMREDIYSWSEYPEGYGIFNFRPQGKVWMNYLGGSIGFSSYMNAGTRISFRAGGHLKLAPQKPALTGFYRFFHPDAYAHTSLETGSIRSNLNQIFFEIVLSGTGQKRLRDH